MTRDEVRKEIASIEPALLQTMDELRAVFGLSIEGIDCGRLQKRIEPPRGRRFVAIPASQLAPDSFAWQRATKDKYAYRKVAAIEPGNGPYRGAADRKVRRIYSGV